MESKYMLSVAIFQHKAKKIKIITATRDFQEKCDKNNKYEKKGEKT